MLTSVILVVVIIMLFVPYGLQKYHEYKHPNDFHFDPEHDSPEVLHHLAKIGYFEKKKYE